MASELSAVPGEIYDFPGNRKKSRVWTVFGFLKKDEGRPPTKENLNMDTAVCRLCRKTYANKGNTTNFQFHIDHEHSATINTKKSVEREKDISKSSANLSTKQAKLSFLPRRKSANRQAELDNALMKLVIGKVLPLSLVESEHFKKFVNLLDSSYIIPSRRDITRKLETQFKEIQGKVKLDISSCENISITHDSWTSLNNDSYDTITAHFIQDWELKSAVLGTSKVDGRHTAENIAGALQQSVEKWGFKNQPLATTDNAANERKAFEILGWSRFGCFGHRINLVVKHALSVQEMAKLLGKGRKLVSFFHSSSSCTGELLKKQKLLLSEDTHEHKLIIDVPTRWNSTLSMLERLCELMPAILSLLANEDALSKAAVTAIKNNAFSFDDQALAEALLKLLKPFAKATEILCSEKIPTMHKVIPTVVKLTRSIALSDEDCKPIKVVKHKMKEELDKRSETEEVSILGCLLNPYTKNFDFLPSLKAEAHQLLKKEADVLLLPEQNIKVKEELDVNNNEPPLPNLPQVNEIIELETVELEQVPVMEPPEKKLKVASEVPFQTTSSKSVDTEDWLDDVVCIGTSTQNNENTVEQEIIRYLNTKVQPGYIGLVERE